MPDPEAMSGHGLSHSAHYGAVTAEPSFDCPVTHATGCPASSGRASKVIMHDHGRNFDQKQAYPMPCHVCRLSIDKVPYGVFEGVALCVIRRGRRVTHATSCPASMRLIVSMCGVLQGLSGVPHHLRDQHIGLVGKLDSAAQPSDQIGDPAKQHEIDGKGDGINDRPCRHSLASGPVPLIGCGLTR